jgi:hypothetical protein
MRVADLSPETRRRIGELRFDWFVEKHEGPWDWSSWLDAMGVEFMTIDGFEVLLPIEQEHHANISIVRCIPSADRKVLTIFLRDTTFYSDMFAGFLAVCEKISDEDWYITLLYHEWFVIDDVPTQFQRPSPETP